ncbi:alpha/beta hydrolase [Sinorhizobium meliloti]|uniref:alpha/beta hydrolase n=1 Tax=Rhizobium meliloti TaxID=382 RepID=UPI0012974C5A|nr:alpha/beta hydrolase [Sinorhizobium meliloti]MQX58191.1 alpha/beta hydrolase fold domain-containing protein [Sinorhizobium meliloti]
MRETMRRLQFDFVPAPDDPSLDADMANAIAKQVELVRLDRGPAKPLQDIRAQQARLSEFWNEGAPDIEAVEAVKIPISDGAPSGRLYQPSRERPPILIYLHGGGWNRGSIASADYTCRHLANESGFAVLSLDYRLAPENSFPAAILDVLAAMDWCRRNAEALNLDGELIFLGGGSAGALRPDPDGATSSHYHWRSRSLCQGNRRSVTLLLQPRGIENEIQDHRIDVRRTHPSFRNMQRCIN